MKKIILSVVIMLGLVTTASAQGVKYQGEVSLGYGIGTGSTAMDKISIHTIHGVRINPYFFAGLGIGTDILTKGEATEGIIPFYASVKGYLPMSKKVSLLAAMNLGYGVHLKANDNNNSNSLSGLYAYPQVGCSFNVGGKKALDVTLGYNHQSLGANGVSFNYGAFAFKVGFSW